MREFLLQLLAQEEDFVSNEDDFFLKSNKKLLQEFEGMFAEPKGFSPNITHDH